MRRLVLLLCLILAFAFAAFWYIKSGLWGSQPMDHAADTPVQTLRLSCPDTPFHGDVVFVTDPARTWTVHIEKIDLPSPPPGYPLSPSSIETHWIPQKGKIEKIDEQSARWTPPLEEGVWTVTVERELVYHSSAPGGFFRRRQPDIIHRARGEIRFVVPHKATTIIGGEINGYTVGSYPDVGDPRVVGKASRPSRIREHRNTYQPPKLWYRIDESTKDLKITQDYRLGDFDLDQRFRPEPYPHYIVIDPNLLLKLEALKKRMNRDGFNVKRFDLIYGFRSPHYNLAQHSLDGDTSLKSLFSVHMYGKASDIIVDRDGDLVMDDLNRDGKIDIEDARVILRYVDELDRTYIRDGSPLVGGAGVYHHHDFWERGEVAQSPYIHIDVRGFTDESGLPIRWVGENTLERHRRGRKDEG